MRLGIYVNPASSYQADAGNWLARGARAHGDDVVRIRGYAAPDRLDAVACWGWRRALRFREHGLDVLVMERAYVADRFHWMSLGWNGLNNRAAFPVVRDGGTRWHRHFAGILKPWRDSGPRPASYALVMGQVPTDSAVRGLDFEAWASRAAIQLAQAGWYVRYRAHPLAPHTRCPGADALDARQPLEAVLAGAGLVVTWNSNSGVDAVLAGVPTVAMDAGSMAYEVAAHDLEDPIQRPDRTTWAHALAWRQWLPAEVEDGTAWQHVRAAKP